MMYLLEKISNLGGAVLTAGHKLCVFLTPVGYQCFVLCERSRQRLLAKYPPKFSQVEAHHITHEYGVAANSPLPVRPRQIEVVGYASDDSLECVVIKIDGQTHRPDGNVYHVTLSREPQRKARESNQLLTQAWQECGGLFLAADPHFRLIRKK